MYPWKGWRGFVFHLPHIDCIVNIVLHVLMNRFVQMCCFLQWSWAPSWHNFKRYLQPVLSESPNQQCYFNMSLPWITLKSLFGHWWDNKSPVIKPINKSGVAEAIWHEQQEKQASFITGNQDKNGLLECMSIFTFAKTESYIVVDKKTKK